MVWLRNFKYSTAISVLVLSSPCCEQLSKDFRKKLE